MPPDGETFAPAMGWPEGARHFHIVEVPQPIAVVSLNTEVALREGEAAVIDANLSSQVQHVAFLSAEGVGTGVVKGRGPVAALATAAAALKVIGGWDESDPIMLEVNGVKVEVRLRFEGTWEAEVKEA
jgi:hypothetical protein